MTNVFEFLFGILISNSSAFSFLCPTIKIYVDKKFGKAWTHGIHQISFSNEFARLLCILSFAFYTLHKHFCIILWVVLIFEIVVAGHVNGDTSLCVGVYPTLVCAVTSWQCFGG